MEPGGCKYRRVYIYISKVGLLGYSELIKVVVEFPDFKFQNTLIVDLVYPL